MMRWQAINSMYGLHRKSPPGQVDPEGVSLLDAGLHFQQPCKKCYLGGEVAFMTPSQTLLNPQMLLPHSWRCAHPTEAWDDDAFAQLGSQS